jgi:hypothetical protein
VGSKQNSATLGHYFRIVAEADTWVALPLRPRRDSKQKSADEAGAASDQPDDRLVATALANS